MPRFGVFTDVSAANADFEARMAAQSAASLPVFNVTSNTYGATGNGVTDDRSAIQSAIDAAVAAGGGIVYFPKGTYYLNSYAPTYTDRILRLANSGSAVSVSLLGAPGTVITTPLYYAGTSSQNTFSLHMSGNLEDCLIEGIDWRNTHPKCNGTTVGIHLNGSTGGTVKRTTIRRNVFRDMARCIWPNGDVDTLIVDNKFLFSAGGDSGNDTGGLGIWGQVSAGAQTTNLRIIGNVCDGFTGTTVACNTIKRGIDGLAWISARGLVIANNTIRNCGIESIYVNSRQSYEATRYPCVIANNTIDATPVPGETVFGQYAIRTDEHMTSVIGNAIRGTNRGIWVSGGSLAAPVRGLSIQHNVIDMLDGATGNSNQGIYCSTIIDSVIVDNTIQWNTAATAGTLSGIQLNNAIRTTARGNKVRAQTKPGGATIYGYYVEGATLADILLVNNESDNVNTSIFGQNTLVGTGTVTITGHVHRNVTTYMGGTNLGTFLNGDPLGSTEAYPGVNSFTYTPRSSAPVQRITGALTGNQTVTLSTTGAIHGDTAAFIKTTAAGAFTCAIGALKTIPASTAARVDITYDRTFGWQLSGYQLL